MSENSLRWQDYPEKAALSDANSYGHSMTAAIPRRYCVAQSVASRSGIHQDASLSFRPQHCSPEISVTSPTFTSALKKSAGVRYCLPGRSLIKKVVSASHESLSALGSSNNSCPFFTHKPSPRRF